MTCLDKINSSEAELLEAMETREFDIVDKVFQRIKRENVDIDAKLYHEADVLHLKLENQLDIRNFMNSVAHVDNYKTIRKSAQTLLDKQEQAEKLGVVLDDDLLRDINMCHSRLISERNLRHQMATQSVPSSTHGDVETLEDLIKKASNFNVEDEYLEQANKLSAQMQGNIKAREILQMLVEYPERVYPDPPPVDAKGKPIKVKEDPKKKKKRKKKEPPFPMPDWAVELEAVQQKVKTLQSLVNNAKEL